MKVKIEFSTRNAAFHDENENLVPQAVVEQVKTTAGIIEHALHTIQQYPLEAQREFAIRDINGNRIGTVQIDNTKSES